MDTEKISSVDLPEVAAPTENTDGVNSGLADRTNGEETGTANPKTELSDGDFEKYLNDIIDGNAQLDVPTEATKDGGAEDTAAAENVDEEQSPGNPDTDDNAPTAPFKTFATEKEYQAEIDRIFSKRHKDYKDKNDRIDYFQNALKRFYGTDSVDDALKAFDAQVLESEAERRGMSTDDVATMHELERKANAYDEQMAQRDAIEAVRARLAEEEQSIRETDPDFDLNKAYEQSADFKRVLNDTGSVYRAYLSIDKTAHQPPATPQKQPPAKQQRTFRETGSMRQSAAGRVETDVSKLSDKDFEDYIKKIKDEY